MAQPRPEERTALKQVLTLVNQLTQQEREELVLQLNLDELRRKIQNGVDQANRGELIDGMELLEELRQRAEARLTRSQQ
jgi:hypothetical protein